MVGDKNGHFCYLSTIRLSQETLSTEHEPNADTVGYGSCYEILLSADWLPGLYIKERIIIKNIIILSAPQGEQKVKVMSI